jgi:hypothetical protein
VTCESSGDAGNGDKTPRCAPKALPEFGSPTGMIDVATKSDYAEVPVYVWDVPAL